MVSRKCRGSFALVAPLAVALALAVAGPAAAGEGAAPPRSRKLADGWRFQPDPLRVGDARGWQERGFDRSGWRPVEVPAAWDFYAPVLDGYEGVGWFAFELPAAWIAEGASQRLRFGRAHHRAVVWIDGARAGENLTGYLPFEIDLGPHLRPGRPAEIVVRVENGVGYDRLPGSTTVEWVQYGGLLEPVELVTTPPAHLAHVAIRAAPADGGGRVEAVVEVANDGAAPFAGRVRLEAGGLAAEADVGVAPGAVALVPLGLVLPAPRLWSPDSPARYPARVRLLEDGRELDALDERFGVRSIETRGREIRLNGEPLRIRGVNRYDEFPGRGPVVDRATIRADLEAVRATGANLVRTHYPQAPVNLELADELGLLVIEEVPLNWWRASWHPPVPPEFENDAIVAVAERALEGMVRRDGNHPSIVAWSVANECETADELGARAMERLLDRAKALDPSRLATYVANRRPELQRAFARADLVAFNLYFGMWDGEIAESLAEIEARVHAPTRAALERLLALFPGQPLVVTEFGTIGVAGAHGDQRFSEEYQAAYLEAVWRAIAGLPEVAGGVVWSWADYRHRTGFTNDFPTEFGPFGLVGLDRVPKRAHAALQALWAAPEP